MIERKIEVRNNQGIKDKRRNKLSKSQNKKIAHSKFYTLKIKR